jgi:hypothetical protein
MIDLEFLVNYLLPPVILSFGMFGNLIGLKLLLHTRFQLMPSRSMFIYLFIFDAIYLLNLLVTYLEVTFGITITILTTITCKLQNYFSYSLASISPMILIFISLQRYFEIKYPNKQLLLTNNRVQLTYLISIIIFNLIFYLPFPILVQKFQIKDEQNQIIICSFISSGLVTFLTYMDLVNRVICPFILMIILIILLIKPLLFNNNNNNNNNNNENHNLIITSIFLNIYNIFLTLPILLNSFFSINEFSFSFTLYVFYVSYAVNFYIILATNSSIRNEFLVMFKCSKPTMTSMNQIIYDRIEANTNSNNHNETDTQMGTTTETIF